jgi:mannosyl-3-phosphoglycerate phosphatase family protein
MLASAPPVARHQPTSAGVVVITDVDGVLRHPDSRSLAEARPALELLAKGASPVVLCSDNSAAELLALQQELGLRYPFICEGGAALYIPGGYFCDCIDLGLTGGDWEVIEFGPPRAEVQAALERAAASLQLPVLTINDMTVQDIAAEWGISSHEAQLAKQRQYTELFRVLEVGERAATRLFTAMRGVGFRCVTGLRFHQATGVTSPAHAVRLLISLYRACGESPVIIGLGGDWRHRSLLREVDAPIVVRSEGVDQTRLLRKVPTAYLTDACGPAGWTEAILGHCSVGRA